MSIQSCYFCAQDVEKLWFWMCLRQVSVPCHFGFPIATIHNHYSTVIPTTCSTVHHYSSVMQWRSQPNILEGNTLTWREQHYFVWDTASWSTKRQGILEILGSLVPMITPMQWCRRDRDLALKLRDRDFIKNSETEVWERNSRLRSLWILRKFFKKM